MYAVMRITGHVGGATAPALLANRLAWLDPVVPIEDRVGAISDMGTAGYVRHIGYPKSASRRCGVQQPCIPSPTFRSNTR
jgi:hypothetical protein